MVGLVSSQAAAAIAAEIELVRRRIEQDKPLLGICFGGQMLSRTLGGEVTRQAAPHIAWETPESAVEELRAPWVLLHNDAFTVPPGAELLAEALGDAVPLIRVKTLEEAVQRAAELAEEGDAVLLSPACASLDMFKNFEERGRLFAQAVEALQ